MRFSKVVVFLIVALVILTAGCVKKTNSGESNVKLKNKVEVYFFYERGCPNCMKIEPYMKTLRKKLKNVDFYFCDLEMGGECSKKANEFLKSHKNMFPKFVPCPTAVIVYKNYTKVLVGYKNITMIGYYLKRFNITAPKIFFNNTTYNIQDCIKCHEEKHIPPPSKYNCTYCCHFKASNQG